MEGYSVRATADTLGITPRTLRRWIAAGEVAGAWQEPGKRGPVWRVPQSAMSELRNRVARDAEPIPVIEPIPVAEPVDPVVVPPDQEQQLKAPQQLAAPRGAVSIIEAMTAATTAAADRERALLERAIDDQSDTIAHLRALLERADAQLAAEREAHAATRRELSQVRELLGLRTRPTVPLRVIHGGDDGATGDGE